MSYNRSHSQIRHVGTGTFVATPRMRELVEGILDSGRISYGEVSRNFERLFALHHNTQYAILSNSGTSSLQVALQTLKEVHGWPNNSEVIVPATTFVATPNIVIESRMKPVFVDVRASTANINPSLIESAITKKTKAIIPVHLFGQPAEMDAVTKIARQYDLKILEDSCETMFAKYQGRPVGSWGDIAAFSLYMAHLLVGGVGGLSLTDNPDYAAGMRSLVNHGLSIENLNADENFAPKFMLGRKFYFDRFGYSYRITEFEAALALAQLEDDPSHTILAPRQRNAQHLAAGIKNANGNYGVDWLQTLKTHPDATHAWMMFPIVISADGATMFSKDEITNYLNANGIETRDMLPILNQPAYSYLNPSDFPVSAKFVHHGFYVGCHQGLTPDDIGYIIFHINRFFEAVKAR